MDYVKDLFGGEDTKPSVAEALKMPIDDTEDAQPEADEQKKLIIQSRHSRAAFTRQCNTLKKFLNSELEESGVTNIDGIMKNLRLKYEDVSNVEEKIQSETPAEHLNKEITSFEKYTEKYEQAIVLTNDYGNKENRLLENSRSENSSSKPRIKFPAIKLQSFTGQPHSREFPEWYELFSKASSHLNGEDRVCLLKSLLKGNAASVLAGVRITASSYDTIVAKQFKKFGSDKILLTKYVKKLVLYDLL